MSKTLTWRIARECDITLLLSIEDEVSSPAIGKRNKMD